MTTPARHSILLGGIGGDCHSVGLTILRHSLQANGYRVHYLGTQNSVQDFFDLCCLFNVAMISSMDGHSRYYLAEFPSRLKQLGTDGPRWYLGGNLSIGDGARAARHFVEMGFNRVFGTFIDIETVLESLRRDLHHVAPRTGFSALETEPATVGDGPAPPDTKLARAEFQRIRSEVLQQWKSGAAARNLADSARFLAKQVSFPRVQAKANCRQVDILLHPRSGVATVDGQIRLFRTLQRAGAGVLSYQVDSFTRLNDYARAEEAIRDSRGSPVPLLNGFPVINHGVPGLRRIISSVPVALQTRHSTRDPALLAEISYAGGVTAFEGGAITYNIPYYKDYPLAESISRWQYVDRLTAHYHARFGIALDREFFGTLTGTLIPPSIAIACDLLESVLAVQQGVKSLSLGYAEQGNRIQDIAAIRTLRSMAMELLLALGYTDVQINTVFHQYMAAFPNDRRLAEQLVYNSAVTAALSGATRVMVKTPAEAFNIPTLDDNVTALRLVEAGLFAARTMAVDEAPLAAECDIIRRETRAILDSVILTGGGGVARGIVNGFRRGYVDVPFAPSIHNRGLVLTCRDLTGAVRFLSVGRLQFDSELRDFHRFKIDERRRAEGILSAAKSYQLVEQDVMQIPRGQYRAWPLSQTSAHQSVCAV